MKLTIAVLYLFFFTIFFLILSAIWHWRMAGAYFVSHDRGYIADFLPPFVRGEGDFYMKPAATVYAIWAVFMVVILLLPAVGSWLVLRLHQTALKKSWM